MMDTAIICHCCKESREKNNAEPRPLVSFPVKGFRDNATLNLCLFCDKLSLERVKNMTSPDTPAL